MSIVAPKPIFCLVLGDAEHWSVEAEWPDGTIELQGPFRSDKLDTHTISTVGAGKDGAPRAVLRSRRLDD